MITPATTTLSAVSMVIIGVLLVARFRSFLRSPLGRYTWLATFFAGNAFFLLGSVVPLRVLDPFLGGKNNWALTMGLCVTWAFWFLYRSLQVLASRRPEPREVLIPVTSSAVFTVSFLMISNTSITSIDFITERIDQVPTYIAITAYLGGLLAVSALSYMCIRHFSGVLYRGLRTGYVLVLLGIVSDLISMASLHFFPSATYLAKFTWNGFIYLFYGGGVALTISILIGFGISMVRSINPTWRFLLFKSMRELAPAAYGEIAGVGKSLVSAVFSRNPLADTYQFVVLVHDRQNFNDLSLTNREMAALKAIESRLEDSLSLPSFTSHSISPGRTLIP